MKLRTLSALDRVECFLYSIKEQEDLKGNRVALPPLFDLRKDQEDFWKNILGVCAGKLFGIYSQNPLEEFRNIVRQSRIIFEEKVFSEGILCFNNRPYAWGYDVIHKADPEFAENLQYFVSIIALVPRGDSPIYIS